MLGYTDYEARSIKKSKVYLAMTRF